jgi:nitrogen fixation protein NifU and related proteins
MVRENEKIRMSDNFDDFARHLQAQIFEETKEAYGTAAFERWLHPMYMGKIDHADGYARVTGPCQDTMEIFLRFEDGRVAEASFQTDGCGSSAVCGSFAAEMAQGKTPDELLDVTGEAILEKLGGLPKEEQHCAFLAGETLQEALSNYMKQQVRK